VLLSDLVRFIDSESETWEQIFLEAYLKAEEESKSNTINSSIKLATIRAK
jgi:hypothetical protein